MALLEVSDLGMDLAQEERGSQAERLWRASYTVRSCRGDSKQRNNYEEVAAQQDLKV